MKATSSVRRTISASDMPAACSASMSAAVVSRGLVATRSTKVRRRRWGCRGWCRRDRRGRHTRRWRPCRRRLRQGCRSGCGARCGRRARRAGRAARHRITRAEHGILGGLRHGKHLRAKLDRGRRRRRGRRGRRAARANGGCLPGGVGCGTCHACAFGFGGKGRVHEMAQTCRRGCPRLAARRGCRPNPRPGGDLPDPPRLKRDARGWARWRASREGARRRFSQSRGTGQQHDRIRFLF